MSGYFSVQDVGGASLCPPAAGALGCARCKT